MPAPAEAGVSDPGSGLTEPGYRLANAGGAVDPNRLVAVPGGRIRLATTLGSGQVFHWRPAGDGFLGLSGSIPLYVEERTGRLRAWPGTEREVARYFALDHPLAQIESGFPRDPAMDAAADYCRGMRILRQPLWECLASFISSAQKQVAHIRQISGALRRRFGERVESPLGMQWAYPDPGTVAAAGEAGLRACGLGYRAPNLLATAARIASGEVDLEAIRQLDDVEARARLMLLPGVGEKVANCVLLFGYERLAAFPVDVWIDRVLRERYFKRKRKVTASRLREFAAVYFGPFGGYAQQYLFHHARSTWRAAGTGGGCDAG